MFRMSKIKLFIVTFVCAVAVLVLAIFLNREKLSEATPELIELSSQIFLTSQLNPKAIPYLRSRGIKTIVDIRPDGETADQPTAAEVKKAANFAELDFYYIPVPHDTIPESAVQDLTATLSDAKSPTLLYCRTGRRAVRLLALAEASRINGPSNESIFEMVHSAGFTAEDLRETIAHRISSRSNSK